MVLQPTASQCAGWERGRPRDGDEYETFGGVRWLWGGTSSESSVGVHGVGNGAADGVRGFFVGLAPAALASAFAAFAAAAAAAADGPPFEW